MGGRFGHAVLPRAFRRHLAEHGVKSGAGIDVLRDAVALVRERQPDSLAA